MKYDFNIIIKRTNRKKTVSFRIKNQEVIISVPKFLSDNEINNLVENFDCIVIENYHENIEEKLLFRRGRSLDCFPSPLNHPNGLYHRQAVLSPDSASDIVFFLSTGGTRSD